MAWIAPDSKINFCSGVPLDIRYADTFFWPNTDEGKSAQLAYFEGKKQFSLEKYQYTRPEGNKIRVEYQSELVRRCNYMYFQNTSFSQKWFFAFITSVSYVSNQTTEVEYVVDVMQTWHFDYTLQPSFVVREHSATDYVGGNIVEEGLETGPMLVDMTDIEPPAWNEPAYIVAATFDKSFNSSAGGTYGGVYSALELNVFTSEGEVNNFIAQAVENHLADGIVSVFQCPYQIAQLPKGSIGATYNVPIPEKISGAIDGYTPKNKKLYTYPYNFLYITDNLGNSNSYRYELFTGDSIQFDLNYCFTPTAECILQPRHYKGSELGNILESLYLSPVVECGYSTNAYAAFIAQNRNQLPLQYEQAYVKGGLNLIGGIVSAVAGVASGGNVASGMASGALSAANAITDMHYTVANMDAKIADIKTAADSFKGTYNASSIMVSMQKNCFSYGNMHITKQYARIIDDYFSLYGYATNEVKVPNRDVRQTWCYTKTVGCNLVGDMPAPELALIRSIYDAGIRFWKNGTRIGSYDQSNKPV